MELQGIGHDDLARSDEPVVVRVMYDVNPGPPQTEERIIRECY